MKTPTWLKNYERPGAAMAGSPVIGMAGKPSRYTGAGKDGVVQKNEPVETELFQDHEGEYVISAADTKKNGGAAGIEEKLGISERKPIPAPIPIHGYCRGGMVRKYAEGGEVIDPNKPKDQSSAGIVLSGPSGTYVTDFSGNAVPISQQAGETITNLQAPMTQKDLAIAADSATPITNADYVAGHQAVRTPEQAAVVTKEDKILNQGPISNADYAAGHAALRTPEQQTTAATQDLLNQPIVSGTQPGTIQTSGGTATASDVFADSRDYFTGKAKDYVGMMDDIATGKSPIFKKMSDMAFNNLNPQIQANLTLTAMQIAQNPNLTSGAKSTIMAQALRNAGIQQSELAGTLASKAMDLANQAIKSGFDMSSNQQSFFETASNNATNQAWKTFEYTAQYGSDEDVIKAYKDATGKDLNPASVTEIRGYARTMNAQSVVLGELNIQSIQNQLGTTKYNAVSSMINTGATLDSVLQAHPEFGLDANGQPLPRSDIETNFNSIKSAGPLGDTSFARDTTALSTLLQNPTPENIASAQTIWNRLYPDTPFDMSGLSDKTTSGNFSTAMGGLTTILATPGLVTYDENGNMTDTGWQAIESALGKTGVDAMGGKDKVQSIYQSMREANSPVARVLACYPDSAILATKPKDDPVSDADYVKIYRSTLASAAVNGYFSVGENGINLTDPENFNKLLKKNGAFGTTPETPEDTPVPIVPIATWNDEHSATDQRKMVDEVIANGDLSPIATAPENSTAYLGVLNNESVKPLDLSSQGSKDPDSPVNVGMINPPKTGAIVNWEGKPAVITKSGRIVDPATNNSALVVSVKDRQGKIWTKVYQGTYHTTSPWYANLDADVSGFDTGWVQKEFSTTDYKDWAYTSY